MIKSKQRPVVNGDRRARCSVESVPEGGWMGFRKQKLLKVIYFSPPLEPYNTISLSLVDVP
jgi:hypothetical protein